MDDQYNEVYICVCVCVYFPQFCDIDNLVEKNSQIYIGIFFPKKKKKTTKTTKNCLPKKSLDSLFWLYHKIEKKTY
jgi:hypothetical protein